MHLAPDVLVAFGVNGQEILQELRTSVVWRKGDRLAMLCILAQPWRVGWPAQCVRKTRAGQCLRLLELREKHLDPFLAGRRQGRASREGAVCSPLLKLPPAPVLASSGARNRSTSEWAVMSSRVEGGWQSALRPPTRAERLGFALEAASIAPITTNPDLYANIASQVFYYTHLGGNELLPGK